MLFSVIIPTYRRRETLIKCLDHLAAKTQNVSPDLFEVVVTDDALKDTPGDTLAQEYPWVRHLAGPQKGPAFNRNNGARAGRGDWLIFLDDDCLPQPGFLRGYEEAIRQHPGTLVFEGKTAADRKQERLDEEAPINDAGGYLWSCNMCIKREFFLEMGGFCELYPFACMEDIDFREQLKVRKVDFLFVPQAAVVHPWRPMVPDEKHYKMLLVSHSIFYLRYPERNPSFLTRLRIVLRLWRNTFFVEAPKLGFRGFKRYFERQVTVTRFEFRSAPFEPDYPVAAAPTRSEEA